MNGKSELSSKSGIRTGELIWPRSLQYTHGEQQERHLMELVDDSEVGVIVDCSLVEAGNSQIINLLIRLRNYAKKAKKEVALFSAPEALIKVINLCKLPSVLPCTDDADAARKLVCDKAGGQAAS